MQSQIQRKEPTDEQRFFKLQDEKLQDAMNVRWLTTEEAREFRRLRAKIAAAEEDYLRRKFRAKGGR